MAQTSAIMTVDAELRGRLATTQVVRFDIAEPSDTVMSHTGTHWLDMCLTPRPRNSRGCYSDHWSPHRFERIGDLFMAPTGETLHMRGDSGRQASVVCLLEMNAIREWFEGEFEWTDRRLEASLDIINPNIRHLMMRLGEEARHPGFATETMTELLNAQLAIELQRHYGSISGAPLTGGLAPWRLKLIDERLGELEETPSLTDLADLCKLSVRQLTRGFRASRGCSIGDYVARSRIDHAKRLLKTDACVKSIAHSMGFSSPSSFSYAFRKATGETPRQFRQRAPRV